MIINQRIEAGAYYQVLNNAIALGKFTGAHSVHTPQLLVEEILSRMPLTGKILVLFNVEFVISLVYTYNVSPDNITFYSDHLNKEMICKKIGNVNIITSLENNMKFDVIVSNPPYSNHDNLLYPVFFKKCLNLAPTVVMIMPIDLESQQVRLKKHNATVKKHLVSMSENITHHFNVGIPDIRYVTASNTVTNDVSYTDPLLDYPIILPERQRLKPRRGLGEFSRKENHDIAGVPCITSVYRGENVQWTTIKPEIANKTKAIMQTSAPWLVLAQEHPSNGLFNVTIIKNNGVKWGSGLFAFDAESEQDAKDLATWLTSDIMQNEIRKLLKIKNTYSISGPMIQKLPRHR